MTFMALIADSVQRHICEMDGYTNERNKINKHGRCQISLGPRYFSSPTSRPHLSMFICLLIYFIKFME